MTSGFRVPPYLHAPSSTGMAIIWFSHTGEPGEVVVTGPGAPGPVTSRPEALDVLSPTEAERTELIEGLAPGSWLYPDGNVRHVVVLTGLRAHTRYTYTVTQDGEQHRAAFRTAPTAGTWQQIHLVALSDSETAPAGRVTHRSWPAGPGGESRPGPHGLWRETFGVAEHTAGRPVLRYPLTKAEGYRAVVSMIAQEDPDLILHPGDLVGGGGYQPAWDEFFTINSPSGLLSRAPLLPALGNWENFGARNGRYGTPSDRSPVVRARAKYHAHFPGPDGARGRGYYRLDHGPLTILTLDSSNGEPDDHRSRYAQPLTGRAYRGPGTDTQHHFTAAEYAAAGGTDLNEIAPGSPQWRWVEENLADARAQGRIILVQFHHVPYSSGAHGLPMDHEFSTGQGGTPMRRFHPMFSEFGVAVVLCGHSELFERSVVPDDDEGSPGVLYYDVGVAGDSLGGELREGDDGELLRYNPHRAWTADQDAPERWEVAGDGNPVLREGGKHYGYLDIDLERAGTGARLTLRPIHAFPVLDSQYRVLHIERRTYDDEVCLAIGPDGRVTRSAGR